MRKHRDLLKEEIIERMTKIFSTRDSSCTKKTVKLKVLGGKVSVFSKNCVIHVNASRCARRFFYHLNSNK